MDTFIIYMVKTALYLAGFYLVYSLLLRRDAAHLRNRFFILLSLILSATFPLISFKAPEAINIGVFGKLLEEVTVSAQGSARVNESPDLLRIIIYTYAGGVVVFMLKTFFDLASLALLIARKRQKNSRIIRFHGFNATAFSALGYIFINDKLDCEDSPAIIDHERYHLKQNHYLDIILIELVTAFQWFNPVIYLFDRELRSIHEFQADRECINSGIAVTRYQNMLLSHVFRTGSIRLTNSFSNPSLVRKRMLMMTRAQASRLSSLKMLLVIPIAGFVSLAVSTETATPAKSRVTSEKTSVAEKTVIPEVRPEKREEENEVPFSVVEEMPVFPGGDKKLLEYIAQNSIYPQEAKDRGLQGRIIVKFCITSTGNISRVSVVNSIDPALDKEALRVVESLPAFRPGRQGGKPVPVWYMVPITFTLR